MALARELVTIAWQMLKHNEPYRYSKPLYEAPADVSAIQIAIQVSCQTKSC